MPTGAAFLKIDSLSFILETFETRLADVGCHGGYTLCEIHTPCRRREGSLGFKFQFKQM